MKGTDVKVSQQSERRRVVAPVCKGHRVVMKKATGDTGRCAQVPVLDEPIASHYRLNRSAFIFYLGTGSSIACPSFSGKDVLRAML